MDSRPASLREQFIQHGIYLRNWSPRTVRTYRQGLASLQQHIGEDLPTKTGVENWIVSLRQKGLTPGGVNMYVRTINKGRMSLQRRRLKRQERFSEKLHNTALGKPTRSGARTNVLAEASRALGEIGLECSE